MIDRNDVAPQFEFPSVSNNVVKLEWPVAPHDVVARVHVVDLDAGNAGVVSVALSERSRDTVFYVRPTGQVRN